MSRVSRCHECGRRYRGGNWVSILDHGQEIALVCPECATVEQHLTAEVNAALLDYGRDSRGLLVCRPKHAIVVPKIAGLQR